MIAAMRILVITDYYREQSENGSEVFCGRLIAYLRQAHQVDVLARASPGSRADINVADALWSDVETVGRFLFEKVDVHRYECVYNLGGLAFGCRIVEFVRILFGAIPLVNHFQTLLEPLARVEGYSDEEAARFGDPQRKAAAGALLNIVLSQDELRFARQVLDLSLHATVVVPNGLPFDEFQDVVPDRSYLPANAEARFVIAAGGRFSDVSKGADLLYRAFAQFQSETPEAFLAVASNADRFITLLEDVPTDRWIRLPWLDRRSFQQLLAGADLVVVPSRYEPFGLIAIEAMSFGVPVLANAVGGLAESIRPHECGALNPLADGSYGLLAAMRKLHSYGPALGQRGKAARLHVRRHYDIVGIAKHIMELLQMATNRVAA
jgi:glycosyltransferase involved in cell wall biosynthesis